MPHLIAAANTSPPVEIMILDYNSPDDLADYTSDVIENDSLIDGNFIAYAKYTGCPYYRMAHARNLSVLASSGEYIVILSADIYPVVEFVEMIRGMIEASGYVWIRGNKYRGAIVCKRQEFIVLGGYDERFEFYGPEDRDLEMRLCRLGGKFGLLPPGLLHVIPTPDSEKVKNYRLNLSKAEMSRLMLPAFEENEADGVIVANQGGEWGQWT
jgi:hypothetical protein